ncbi:hypothetical protein Phi17:1_gp46 [Cellulophaga phage phi17:1]|uniref:Uncharacterized protein n=1 Tax=Cellulophaga phage phi17:1 TaxID=1327980 RepID=S0A1G1_9CAUD|nr:hypothetical protein Phi17:1_gp46 [Cellulophaga phage phi17:1]AGO48322.1 hypothetical protein Phi17:1_gp46 [Cellulophaga phage phi17:1]
MNELDVINEALNMATLKGCFDMQQVNKISHSFGVVAQRLDELGRKLEGAEKDVDNRLKQIRNLEVENRSISDYISNQNIHVNELKSEIDRLKNEPEPHASYVVDPSALIDNSEHMTNELKDKLDKVTKKPKHK